MKKYLILTVSCLVVSLFLFGNFNEIQSSSANIAALTKALDDAEIRQTGDAFHQRAATHPTSIHRFLMPPPSLGYTHLSLTRCVLQI